MRDKQEQLEWEARVGRLAGFASLLAAALSVGALGYRIGALPHGAKNVKASLRDAKAHKTAFLVSGALPGMGMLAFTPPLLYLYEATHYRRQELPNVARILIIA